MFLKETLSTTLCNNFQKLQLSSMQVQAVFFSGRYQIWVSHLNMTKISSVSA